jgi:hypothetical protein
MVTRVKVLWEDETGASLSDPALVEDRSSGGVGVRLDRPIPVGTNVKINLFQQEYTGIVRHCHAEGRAYVAGVQWTGPPAEWRKPGS